ncbi:MAG: response regulator [Caulobacteraceae bacterium]
MPNALLVEDEALVAMIAEDYLRDLGYEPIAAKSAAEALAAINGDAALAFAVVDVGLPDGRGDDLALTMRQLRPEMPVILASGYDPGELGAKFTGDDKVRLMGKPYTGADLTKALAGLGLSTSQA